MPASLTDLVRRGGTVALTGAGVSTDSGIPDYRGDPARVRRPPIDYQEFVGDAGARRRYWARSHLGWRRITGAAPNAAHRVLEALEAQGLVGAVITQNVDGLHTAAGSQRVLELHGSLHRTVCLGCGERRSRLELHHRLAAANPRFDLTPREFAPDGDAVIPDAVAARFEVVDCLACGGILKPDVVFFGENVPRARADEALAKKHNCLACHQVDKKVIGPAYKDIARKYKGQKAAAQLEQKVKKGGGGVWGQIPMPPNAAVPDKDIHQLVEWILKL